MGFLRTGDGVDPGTWARVFFCLLSLVSLPPPWDWRLATPWRVALWLAIQSSVVSFHVGTASLLLPTC
jgi:hypothetical protein